MPPELGFLTDLVVRDIDGNKWQLMGPLIYAEPETTYVAPTAFITDLASIPRIVFWRAKSGPWNEAAVLHDASYSGDLLVQPPRTLTRADADALFQRAMKASGVGWWTRSLFYAAVRLGGGGLWDKRREARA